MLKHVKVQIKRQSIRKWLEPVKDVLHRYPGGCQKAVMQVHYIVYMTRAYLWHENPGENRMNSKAVRPASIKHKY